VNNRKRVERILSYSLFEDNTLDFVEIKRGVLQEPSENATEPTDEENN